jgi:hypothetical protein
MTDRLRRAFDDLVRVEIGAISLIAAGLFDNSLV